jgi:hypothetical protein
MKLKVVSPSKNRLDFTIVKVLGDVVTLFVEPQDQTKYVKRNPNLRIVKIDKNNTGFGYVLSFIVERYYAKGFRYVLFSDDDVFGLKTRDNKRVENIKEFLSEGVSIMEQHDYAQLMVSFSGHNWYEKRDIKEDVGCWGMVFLDLEKIKSVGNYDTELKIFNDWDMSARLITAGYKTACWYKYMFEHKMKSKKGGAYDMYQHADFMLQQCKMMERKHGNTVRIMYHERHQQYEIRFNWKKVKEKRRRVGISKFLGA